MTHFRRWVAFRDRKKMIPILPQRLEKIKNLLQFVLYSFPGQKFHVGWFPSRLRMYMAQLVEHIHPALPFSYQLEVKSTERTENQIIYNDE